MDDIVTKARSKTTLKRSKKKTATKGQLSDEQKQAYLDQLTDKDYLNIANKMISNQDK